jgi:hypothetical protein
MDVNEMRRVLARVAAYRGVCEAVRRGANHTLFNGLLFLGLTYFWYSQVGRVDGIMIAYAAIGVGEVLVGLWKKARPSPEGVLVDSLLQFAFVASIAVRQGLLMNAGFQPNPVSIFIGIWVLIDGVRTFQAYMTLNRAFAERPTREQLSQVRALAQEVINADPTTDQSALDLPVRPPLAARLMGDVALVAEVRSGTLFLVDRRGFQLVRTGSESHPDSCVLIVEGQEWGEFACDPGTWANYVRWQPEAAR